MYSNGSQSSDPNQGNSTNRHMKVVYPNHPIMQGIPLDAQGRVKIFRDPYPEENLHVPTGARANYEFRFCTQAVENAAPGTVILGVLAGESAFDGTNRACLAVCDVGGILAVNPNLGYAETNQVRLVHMFVNEQGSGGSRRIFNALTDLGRIIFVRAAKWAMGETLEPYQGLGLIEVSLTGPKQIQLSWQGRADRNYKILGIRDLLQADDITKWQTVVQDIPGANGLVSRKLEISAGQQYAFLRVAPMQ